MFRGRVKGIKRVQAKGRVYYYHRRTKTRIKAAFGSPEFILEVARLEAGSQPTARPGTLGMLIDAYRKSPFWHDLKPATRITYDRAFEVLAPLRGMPLVEFRASWVAALRDEVNDKRGRWMAKNVRAVLSIIAEFAREKEWLSDNPVRRVRGLRRDQQKPRLNRGWKEQECRTVIEAAPDYLRPAIALAMFAGLRKTDVLTVRKDAISDGILRMLTSKRGIEVAIPVHPQLAQILANAPRHSAPTVVANSRGESWTASGFNSTFGKFIGRLEQSGRVASGLTMHGLRHTVGQRLREAGADLDDIRRILGQRTLSMAQHYSDAADRTAEARLTVAKLDIFGEKRAEKMENPASELEN
ncbi:tyrosine-type recombinase/integrase [Starkeya sp. ORNL1]|uniref:tyrosine-type recombinase/integrase n=1 Tax=Starkeya sp. ORNL1 TaxID=2709380 RepID=UPI0014645414|nr:tyrosine-type recombinase/integrase [Starkeya sp. ORNL1]QJP14619.1 tyrosine-type recombinase/integrase [Starkeya sp. ORNL1]